MRNKALSMSYDELRVSYDQALRMYTAAMAGHGDRVTAFVQFLMAERALNSHLGIDVPQWCGEAFSIPAQ